MKKIHYVDTGNPKGRTIIFIHGWSGDHRHAMDITYRFYKDEYRCIYVDLLGYGKSDKYEKRFSIGVQSAEAIADMMKELDLKDVIIYGNCMGGNIGSLVCTIIPDRIKAFVWVDGYLFLEKHYLPFVTPIISYPFYNFFFHTKTGLELSNKFVKFSDRISDEIIANQKSTPTSLATAYIRDLYLMTKKPEFMDVVKKVPHVSLYIIGEYTMPVIKRSQKYWMENAQKPYAEVVSNSHHLTAIENPEELNAKIKNFLNTAAL